MMPENPAPIQTTLTRGDSSIEKLGSVKASVEAAVVMDINGETSSF
jgi:hypothetical protein